MAVEETTENKGYGKRPMWQWIAFYLTIAVILYGGFYYFFLSKKTTYNSNTTPKSAYSTPTTTNTMSPTSSAVMLSEITVDLNQENKSGESGTATLKEDSGKTTVTLNLTGFTKGVSQPTHIHVGNCPGVGAVKYPLTDVVNGKSVTILSVTLDELKKSLPLAINVHASAKDITNYTACGELTSK